MTKQKKVKLAADESQPGLRFAVRDFHNWSVKDVSDQINLMKGTQARIALLAIKDGMSLQQAIIMGYSYPPSD